jgi:Tol biopolymer transport system component
VPQDVFVPGHLIYVKGSTIYMIHHYDQPVPLAVGREPAVSPDGTRMAYIAFYKNFQDLMLLNIQQRTSTKLVNDELTNPQDASTGLTAAEPSWSNDGKSIYFSWSYPGAPMLGSPNTFDRQDLSVTRCAVAGPCTTATAVKLTTPYFQAGGDFEAAQRLADPSYVVYTKWQYQQARDNTSRSLPRLVALNLNAGSEVDLTTTQDNVSEPVWSPNGRYLAFVKTSDDLQSSSIRVMAFHPPGRISDYSQSRLLVKGGPLVGHPVFSPDGQYLAYLQQASDGRFHIFIARVHLGRTAHIDTPQEVKRSDIVDGDRLAWTQ